MKKLLNASAIALFVLSMLCLVMPMTAILNSPSKNLDMAVIIVIAIVIAICITLLIVAVLAMFNFVNEAKNIKALKK